MVTCSLLPLKCEQRSAGVMMRASREHAIYDCLVLPPLLCQQWYTRAMVHTSYNCLVLPHPNLQAMIRACFDARGLRYTRATIALSPPQICEQ